MCQNGCGRSHLPYRARIGARSGLRHEEPPVIWPTPLESTLPGTAPRPAGPTRRSAAAVRRQPATSPLWPAGNGRLGRFLDRSAWHDPTDIDEATCAMGTHSNAMGGAPRAGRRSATTERPSRALGAQCRITLGGAASNRRTARRQTPCEQARRSNSATGWNERCRSRSRSCRTMEGF